MGSSLSAFGTEAPNCTAPGSKSGRTSCSPASDFARPLPLLHPQPGSLMTLIVHLYIWLLAAEKLRRKGKYQIPGCSWLFPYKNLFQKEQKMEKGHLHKVREKIFLNR